MIRRQYCYGIAASVVLLLCSALSCRALLCLPPASSSSLVAEEWQRRLHSLSGLAVSKGGDCRQPLLAGGTPSSLCRAAKHGAPMGLGGNAAGEGTSAPLRAVGLGWVPVPLRHPQWCEVPQGQTLAPQDQIKSGTGRWRVYKQRVRDPYSLSLLLRVY